MANRQLLKLLRERSRISVWRVWHVWRKELPDRWNAWRKEHPDRLIDLSGADLRRTFLLRADLSRVDLRRANLSRDVLIDINLSQANLSGANLSGADLREADFTGTNLVGADLTGANLVRAFLSNADLTGANLSNADIGYTTFGNIDLRNVTGLETINHRFSSIVGIDTILRSGGNIPAMFLRGTGAIDTIIDYVRSLAQRQIDYYTCFISYSSQDDEFVHLLLDDLQDNGVLCWFAAEDLMIGDKFWHRIDESIRIYDKLMVVLSEHSVDSLWVEREVLAVLEKEQQRHTLVLFPITLDEAVKHTSAPWAANIHRSRHIGDFTRWKDQDAYQKAFARLLRDLKAQTQKMGSQDATTNDS